MRFSEIVGQEKVKDFFRRVVSEGRIPHAYLFTGMSGVGKTSTAKALTMALNCREARGIEACGSCPPCRQMAGGNFPDFISISPDGQNIKIEQIREVNRRLSFAPVASTYRVVVIEQAEAMTGEAANSFLKILEEPPEGNILILNAVEHRNLLPTIVSRCQRVPFQPIPEGAMIEWLIQRKGVDRQRATIAARASGGSLGRALEVSDEAYIGKRKVWLSDFRRLPTLSKGDAVAMALGWAKMHQTRESSAGERGEPGLQEMLAVWGGWYRDLLILKAGASVDLLTNVDLAEQLTEASRSTTLEGLTASLLLIDQAGRDLRRMGNPKVVMVYTVLGLHREWAKTA